MCPRSNASSLFHVVAQGGMRPRGFLSAPTRGHFKCDLGAVGGLLPGGDAGGEAHVGVKRELGIAGIHLRPPFSSVSPWAHLVTSLSLSFLTCHMGIHTAPTLCDIWELPIRPQALGVGVPVSFITEFPA